MTKYLIDTNLLVLLVLGGSDRSLIGRHKRLKNFDQVDFDGLETILRDATVLVTLPYILAETSNLIGVGKRDASLDAMNRFEFFIRQADEYEVKSEAIIGSPYFRRFGLTDTAIIHLIRDRVHVLTVDHALCGILDDVGIKTTNLRHRTRL